MNKKCRQIRDLVLSDVSYGEGDFVFALLLMTSHFEFRLRTILRKLLNNRETKWEMAKSEARVRLMELSEIYGKSKEVVGTSDHSKAADNANNFPNLTTSGSSSRHLVKSQHLEKWFVEREKQVEDLQLNGMRFGIC